MNIPSGQLSAKTFVNKVSLSLSKGNVPSGQHNDRGRRRRDLGDDRLDRCPRRRPLAAGRPTATGVLQPDRRRRATVGRRA